MPNPAITTSNPASSCPAWCVEDHHNQQLIPDEHGWWNVLHLSAPEAVFTAEVLPADAVVELTVQLQHYLSETYADPRDLLIWVRASSGHSGERPVDFTITARQALRLAEVLVQQAATALVEQATTTVVTR